MDVAAAKDKARRMARLTRREAFKNGPSASEQIARHAGSFAEFVPDGGVVAGYWPKGDEADPRPLMATLAGAGYGLALPSVDCPDSPLIFRRYRTGDSLVAGAFGVMEPSAEAPQTAVDTVVLPLLAFDEFGYRLGYGGGYYDRTLLELRATASVTAIGLGFALQCVPRLPREAHDQPLDGVLTEDGVRWFDRAANARQE